MRQDGARPLAGALLAAALAVAGWTAAQAADPLAPSGDEGAAAAASGSQSVDMDDIFGFTTGGRTDAAGELDFDTALTMGVGGRTLDATGRPVSLDYTSADFDIDSEYGVTDWFSVIGTANLNYYDIGYPDGEHTSALGFGGFSLEAKIGLVKADANQPVDVALAITGDWSRYSSTGEQLDGFELTTLLAADTTLVPNLLFGAVNLEFSTGTSEADPGGAVWDKDSGLAAGLAMAVRLSDRVFVGAETQFANAFDGSFLNEHVGYAVSAGPTAYLKVSDSVYVKAAWSTQLFGHSDADPGSNLNLIDYQRHMMFVGAGISF